MNNIFKIKLFAVLDAFAGYAMIYGVSMLEATEIVLKLTQIAIGFATTYAIFKKAKRLDK